MNDEHLKTARIILDTFSFCASLSISARIGITPYLKREQVRKDLGPMGYYLFSLVARGMLKLVTQRQNVSWYWIWKFTCMSSVRLFI